MNWHSIKKREVLREFRTTSGGLTSQEAASRLTKYGKNLIKETYKISPIKIFFSQFNSFLIYILLAATIISFLIKHYLDAGAIFAIILLNAVIGFVQQYKAEKSIIQLKKILVPNSKVLRANRMKQISSTNLVPGDILILNQGDKITADCRIIESENLEINEAILTGESLPVSKSIKLIPTNTVLAERKNMLYTGTSVVRGSGKAIVVATGMRTEFGKIAGQLQKIKLEKTPMQKRLDRFAKQITFVILGLVIILDLNCISSFSNSRRAASNNYYFLSISSFLHAKTKNINQKTSSSRNPWKCNSDLFRQNRNNHPRKNVSHFNFFKQ